MISIRGGLPREGATLALGVVIGYGDTAHPVAGVEKAPSLLVRIDTVLSGRIAARETQVVPLFYGPNCRSAPTAHQVLERSYPIGATIVFANASVSHPVASEDTIVVENNQGGYVVTVPGNVKRTSAGDLDFEQFDASRAWQFGEFEFARAVLALRRARQSERFGRLMNLVHYEGFLDLHGREKLEQLISESRITPSQRDAVMKALTEQVPGAR
jgi:hypothetical protein